MRLPLLFLIFSALPLIFAFRMNPGVNLGSGDQSSVTGNLTKHHSTSISSSVTGKSSSNSISADCRRCGSSSSNSISADCHHCGSSSSVSSSSFSSSTGKGSSSGSSTGGRRSSSISAFCDGPHCPKENNERTSGRLGKGVKIN